MDDHAPNAFAAAVMAYFRAPDGLAIVGQFTAEPVTERWRAQTVLTLPVFLALVMDGQPDCATALVDSVLSGDPVKIEMVAQALNYSHHANRRRLMERLVGEQAAGAMDEDGALFKDLLPTHPIHVDMLWAAYFATGDGDYVDRIIGLLAGWMPEPQLQPLLAVAARDEAVAQRAMAGVLASAAQTSLTANAADLCEIRAMLESYAARQDGLASAMAARIVAGCS